LSFIFYQCLTTWVFQGQTDYVLLGLDFWFKLGLSEAQLVGIFMGGGGCTGFKLLE